MKFYLTQSVSFFSVRQNFNYYLKNILKNSGSGQELRRFPGFPGVVMKI